MADAGTSRAFRWTSVDGTADSNSGQSATPRTIAQNVARCHRAAATSALQARRLIAGADVAQWHTRVVSYISIGAACASVLCITAPLYLDSKEHNLVIYMSLLGIALNAASILMLVVRVIPYNSGEKRLAASIISAKAHAISKICTDFGQMFVEMGDEIDQNAFKAADALLDTLEADVAALRQDEVRENGSAPSKRRHRRIVPRQRRVIVRTEDGRNLMGAIANVSISGVALDRRLPRIEIGDKVVIGQKPAIVARQSDRSTVLQFRSALDPSTFNEDIVL